MPDKNLVNVCNSDIGYINVYVDEDGQERAFTLESAPEIIKEQYRAMLILHKLSKRLDRAIVEEDYETAGRIHSRIKNIERKYAPQLGEEDKHAR
jgi:hypothetical protein